LDSYPSLDELKQQDMFAWARYRCRGAG